MDGKCMKVKNQKLTRRFALYNGDCCEVLPDLPDESVGFSVFSPPFADLYSYSDDERDMSNAASYEEFFEHFGFLIGQLERLIMPGRVVAVHCCDLPTFKSNGDPIGIKDFSGDIIRAFLGQGFIFHSRHCIWKDPLIAAVRTKAIGLAHKQVVKDSSLIRTGIPDYIVCFRKPGENPRPIENRNALTEYHGSRSVPTNLDRFIGHEDARTNKRSHWIWQQYASPVWFDVRQTRVLKFREAKGKDDEKHICPLQLDTIERCVSLWSAKGDTVLSPYMGVGSEVYVAVKNRRKAIGVELKTSYYRQALKNLESLRNRKGLT
jgi:DNA modification methylase